MQARVFLRKKDARDLYHLYWRHSLLLWELHTFLNHPQLPANSPVLTLHLQEVGLILWHFSLGEALLCTICDPSVIVQPFLSCHPDLGLGLAVPLLPEVIFTLPYAVNSGRALPTNSELQTCASCVQAFAQSMNYLLVIYTIFHFFVFSHIFVVLIQEYALPLSVQSPFISNSLTFKKLWRTSLFSFCYIILCILPSLSFVSSCIIVFFSFVKYFSL